MTREQLEMARRIRSRGGANSEFSVANIAQALTWREHGEAERDVEATLAIPIHSIRSLRRAKRDLTEPRPALSLKWTLISLELERAVNGAFRSGIRSPVTAAIVAHILIRRMKDILAGRIRQELLKVGLDVSVQSIAAWWRRHQDIEVFTTEDTVRRTYSLAEYVAKEGL
jgi:hypothetical protein